MIKRFLILMFVVLISLSVVFAVPQYKYHNYEEMKEILNELVNNNQDIAKLHSLGKTLEGRDVLLVEITNFDKGDPAKKPGIFISANLEGDHLIGSEIILNTMKYIIDNYKSGGKVKKLVDNRVFYFVPRVNPDAAELMFNSVKLNQRVNFTPVDDDNDGLIDEDGPEDLNNDGYITMMRVKDPEGEYMIDPEDSRLMKKADPSKGEKGEYKIYTEGIDNDGDGKYNEDGPGGVNINMNFPHNYPYYKNGAGKFMVSENESRAVIDFIFSHRNIAVMLTYNLWDNLVTAPKPGKEKELDYSKFIDSRGRFRIPRDMDISQLRKLMRGQKAPRNISSIDIPYYKEVGKKYREITGSGATSTGIPEGAFFDWGYFQYGVPSFSAKIWDVPSTKGEKTGVKGKQKIKKEKKSKDKKWLEWIDKENQGEGFINWKPFTHPVLGEVEIGGFKPFIKLNPPERMIKDISEKHAKFTVYLAGLCPEVKISELKAENLGSSIYKVKARIQNNGYFPTAMNHALRARAVKPTLVKINLERDKILSGEKINFISLIQGSGKNIELKWLIKSKTGEKIVITVDSQKGGSVAKELILQ